MIKMVLGAIDGRGAHAHLLAGQAALAKKIPRTQRRDDGLAAGLGEDREPDGAVLNVEDLSGGIALGKNQLVRRVLDDFPLHTRRIQELLRVEAARSRVEELF